MAIPAEIGSKNATSIFEGITLKEAKVLNYALERFFTQDCTDLNFIQKFNDSISLVEEEGLETLFADFDDLNATVDILGQFLYDNYNNLVSELKGEPVSD